MNDDTLVKLFTLVYRYKHLSPYPYLETGGLYFSVFGRIKLVSSERKLNSYRHYFELYFTPGNINGFLMNDWKLRYVVNNKVYLFTNFNSTIIDVQWGCNQFEDILYLEIQTEEEIQND